MTSVNVRVQSEVVMPGPVTVPSFRPVMVIPTTVRVDPLMHRTAGSVAVD